MTMLNDLVSARRLTICPEALMAILSPVFMEGTSAISASVGSRTSKDSFFDESLGLIVTSTEARVNKPRKTGRTTCNLYVHFSPVRNSD
jgi:hypothetical protein